MSLLRTQNIYKFNFKEHKLYKDGIELLAGSDLLDKLFFTLKVQDNLIRESGKINFDSEIINIINKNKKKLERIIKSENLKIVSLNLFPETIEGILKYKDNSDNKKLLEKLKRISSVVRNIEIIEDISNPNCYLEKYCDKLREQFIEKMGFKIGLDDITSKIINSEIDKGFIIEDILDYFDKGIISFIKIDIKLTQFILNNVEKREIILDLIEEIINKNPNILIIFEGIETKKDFDTFIKIMKKVLHEKNNYSNIHIQGFFFHKPVVIVEK